LIKNLDYKKDEVEAKPKGMPRILMPPRGDNKIWQGGQTQEVRQMEPKPNTYNVEQRTPHNLIGKQNDQM
jgi:hypothetical protein